MNVGDVVNVDWHPVDDSNGQIVEFGDLAWRVVERNDILELADFFRSHRRDDVLLRDRFDDVLGREPVGLQLFLVEIDLDLQHLAAVGRRNSGSRDRRELRTDEILSRVENFACDNDLLDNASWRTGTLEALKLRTKGGVMPGGQHLSTVCEAAVICARAPN